MIGTSLLGRAFKDRLLPNKGIRIDSVFNDERSSPETFGRFSCSQGQTLEACLVTEISVYPLCQIAADGSATDDPDLFHGSHTQEKSDGLSKNNSIH